MAGVARLLRAGHTVRTKQFLEWYASFLKIGKTKFPPSWQFMWDVRKETLLEYYKKGKTPEQVATEYVDGWEL